MRSSIARSPLAPPAPTGQHSGTSHLFRARRSSLASSAEPAALAAWFRPDTVPFANMPNGGLRFGASPLGLSKQESGLWGKLWLGLITDLDNKRSSRPIRPFLWLQPGEYLLYDSVSIGDSSFVLVVSVTLNAACWFSLYSNCGERVPRFKDGVQLSGSCRSPRAVPANCCQPPALTTEEKANRKLVWQTDR